MAVEANGQAGADESNQPEPVVIKKYANRRLYNTKASTYVTLEHLSEMVREGVDFVVLDAKTDDDITRSVLAQIIFEQESRGQNLLPVAFLRRLIRFYGDQMQGFLPPYLDMSMESFSKAQEQIRDNFSRTFGVATPMTAFEDLTQRNMVMFQKAMQAWTPLAGAMPGMPGMPGAQSASAAAKATEKTTASEPTDSEVEALRMQMAAMQKQLDAIARKG